MSQNMISTAQALGLYQSFIQQQIQELRRTRPAFVNSPSIIVGEGNVWLSYPQMLGEVQRKTTIGINQAIQHATGLGYQVVP